MSHDPKAYDCVDCGGPVRRGNKRCRKCYLDNAFARSAKGKSNLSRVPVEEESVFARMDAKFCAAMERAHPELAQRP